MQQREYYENSDNNDNIFGSEPADSCEDDEGGVEFITETRDPETERNSPSNLRYYDLLSKVRKVVKIFKNSPTKNDDILQKYVVSEYDV